MVKTILFVLSCGFCSIYSLILVQTRRQQNLDNTASVLIETDKTRK